MYQNFDLSSQSLRTLVSIFQTFLYVSPMTIENVSMCILSHYTPNFNQSVILIFMMYTNFFWNKTTTTAVFHVLFLLITLRKCMCMYSSSCYIGMVHVCICVQNKPHAITTVNTRGYTTPLLPSLFLSLLNARVRLFEPIDVHL